MSKNYKVIAVSAIAGGGKSTVTRKLVELLGDAVSIHFDDYTTAETYPEDPAALLKEGADFNMIKSPLLAQHLQALRTGNVVTNPNTGEAIVPARHIIFEGPLGRAQHETGQHIDFLVFIDTPLEIGLARMVSRLIPPAEEEMAAGELKERFNALKGLLNGYLSWMRLGYLAQFDQIRPVSDLVLAWNQPVEDQAQAIIDALAEAQ